MKRGKWIRRSIYACIALAVLVAVVVIAVPWAARRRLVTVLQQQIGGPVEVDRVGLTLGQIEARGLRLFDGATPPRRWLSVGRAALDVTLWEALRGNATPKRLTVEGLVATFELDKSTKLIDDFTPWADGFEFPFERIDIRNARVEIRPKGQPAFGLDHIEMSIRGPTETIRAEGAIIGSLGGVWDVSAEINGKTLEATCTLASEELPVSTDLLGKLPYVPTDLLQRVQARGVASARLTFQNIPSDGFHYVGAVALRHLNATLPKENLTLTDGRCDVLLQDGVLTLKDLQGRIAGGRVNLTGGINLLDPVRQGHIKGDLSDFDLDTLPDAWPGERSAAKRHCVSTDRGRARFMSILSEFARSSFLSPGMRSPTPPGFDWMRRSAASLRRAASTPWAKHACRKDTSRACRFEMSVAPWAGCSIPRAATARCDCD